MDHSLSPKDNDVRYFLVSWDNLGIEFLQDITQYHPELWGQEQLLERLKSGEKKEDELSKLVNMILLRARVNSQRHYEVYVFTAANSLTTDDIREYGENTPQDFANFVRKNHSLKILDNRARLDEIKIV